MNKSRILNSGIKILFAIAVFIFSLPSIVYIVKNGNIVGFEEFYQFLLNDINPNIQTTLYVAILTIITIFYFYILKKHKSLFSNIKQTMIYILIISSIALIVLPFTSSDIYYYMGVGRLDSEYNQNPYKISMNQYIQNNPEETKEDEILQKGSQYWGDSTVVYGPVWTFICKIFSWLSFGSVSLGLLIFKIASLIVHMANCYLIFKLTKKKLFVLLYGLNPFILLEALGNVHNDIYVVFLTLCSLYFVFKKKNLVVSVVLLGIATAIKYFTVLLLPFIIIYYYRKEHPKIRFLKCIQYGMIFVVTVVLTYLMYIENLSFLDGMMTQQGKYAKSIYLVIYMLTDDFGIVGIVQTLMLGIFTIYYITTCINWLTAKTIKRYKIMKAYELIVIIFLFLLITNFQPWYIMWLFPAIFWLKGNDIRKVINITIVSQYANIVFLLYGESYQNGVPFVIFLTIGTIMLTMIQIYVKQSKNGKKEGLKSG